MFVICYAGSRPRYIRGSLVAVSLTGKTTNQSFVGGMKNEHVRLLKSQNNGDRRVVTQIFNKVDRD